MRRQANLTVVMGVADHGDFTAVLPIVQGKRNARFTRAGKPDLMGNALYTDISEGVSICALRTDNGTLDKNAAGKYFWRGIVRYNSYKLVAPVGSVLVMEDGTVGTEVVLHSNATLIFQPRATIETRFAICRPELVDLAKAKIRYEDLEGYVWQPLAGNYGPSQSPLPDVSGMGYEATCAAEYESWLAAWRSGQPLGNWESNAKRIGPRMQAGEDAAYTHGGNGISPSHGYEQCRSAVLSHRFKHSRWMDRMFAAIFDSSGKQLTALDFTTPVKIAQIRGAGPWQWQNELTVFLSGGYDNAQYPWYNPGAASQEADTWKWYGVDNAHIIRAILHGIAAWEYTQDPMIADDLVMLFENIRLTEFSDNPNDVAFDANYTPPSIKALAHRVAQWPHQGLEIDRAFGWALYLGAQVTRMGFSRRSWLRQMTIVADNAMMPNGIVSRNYSEYFPNATTQGVQTFHEMIICIGFHAACVQLGRSPNRKLALVCGSILDNPKLPPIEYGGSGSMGPPHWIWTHVNRTTPVAIETAHSNGEGDPAHTNHVLALTLQTRPDRRLLETVNKHWFVTANSQAKLAILKTMKDKSWGGTLQAVLENLRG